MDEKEDWNDTQNWTNNRLPFEYETVEFATVANNEAAAVNNLKLPTGLNVNIGSLINETNLATIISAGSSMTITGKVIGSETKDDIYKIQVLAEAGKPNGALILSGQPCNEPVYGTVQLYAKGKKQDKVEWEDDILHSPTKGEKFSSEYQWQHFGIPVQTIKTTPTFAGHYLREYFESLNAEKSYYYKWVNLRNDEDMRAFAGYAITQDNPGTVNISGELVFCDKDVALTHTAPPVTNSGSSNIYNSRYGLGQNIIGNSFTAAIPIDKIDFNTVKVNDAAIPNNNASGNLVEHTVYLYNTGSFAEWTAGSTSETATLAGSYISIPANAATGLEYGAIPSLNGFLLRHIGGDGKVIKVTMPYGELKNNTKPQTVPSFAPKAPLAYLHIGLTSASTVDNLWLFSQEGTTEGFDNGWDGRKNFGTPTAFIYSLTEDGPMQVNTSSSIDGKVINFYPNEDTDYTLKLVKTNLTDYNDLNLIDLETKTITELSADTTLYRFNSLNKGISTGRFIIVNKPISTINLNNGDFNLLDGYITPDRKITALNYTNHTGQMYIHNAVGKLVMSDRMNQGTNVYSLNLETGVYILTMQADKETKSVKVIVR